jgi:lysophospholipid hydrolase
MASGLSTTAVNLTMASELPSTMNATTQMAASQQSSGWLGLFGWLIYTFLNLVSLILYWILRIATINVPSILYTLFSTSWTVTMNATTLYVPRSLAFQ